MHSLLTGGTSIWLQRCHLGDKCKYSGDKSLFKVKGNVVLLCISARIASCCSPYFGNYYTFIDCVTSGSPWILVSINFVHLYIKQHFDLVTLLYKNYWMLSSWNISRSFWPASQLVLGTCSLAQWFLQEVWCTCCKHKVLPKGADGLWSLDWQ